MPLTALFLFLRSEWFLESPLVYNFTQYAQYIIVADETYFATLFRHSPYCNYHVACGLSVFTPTISNVPLRRESS